jgi:hypothetical protein
LLYHLRTPLKILNQNKESFEDPAVGLLAKIFEF